MRQNNYIIPKYLSSNGKYLGCSSRGKIPKGRKIRFSVPDNNSLEHIIEGIVVVCEKTNNYYAYLIELNPPAPQRVRDMHFFKNEGYSEIGCVDYKHLIIYTDIVFIIGKSFSIKFHCESIDKTIEIKGKIIAEEKEYIPSNAKYAFWVKLNERLSEEDYQALKKIDIDDINNYFGI